jgi:hypothetical protein
LANIERWQGDYFSMRIDLRQPNMGCASGSSMVFKNHETQIAYIIHIP